MLCALVRGHSGSMGWRRSKRCHEQALCIQVQMEEFRALPWVPQDAPGPSTVRGYLMDRTPGRNLISQAAAEVGGELACVCGPLPTVALRPHIPNTFPGSILVGRNDLLSFTSPLPFSFGSTSFRIGTKKKVKGKGF